MLQKAVERRGAGGVATRLLRSIIFLLMSRDQTLTTPQQTTLFTEGNLAENP